MTYVSLESECALEGYRWCLGLCPVAAAVSEGNCPPQIPTPGRYKST
jgi:hypothetical protein